MHGSAACQSIHPVALAQPLCSHVTLQVLEIMQDGQHIVRLAEGQAPQVIAASQQQQQNLQQQQQQQRQQLEGTQQQAMLQPMQQKQLQPQPATIVEQQQRQQQRQEQQSPQNRGSRGSMLGAAIANLFAVEYGAQHRGSSSNGDTRDPTPA